MCEELTCPSSTTGRIRPSVLSQAQYSDPVVEVNINADLGNGNLSIRSDNRRASSRCCGNLPFIRIVQIIVIP